MSATVIISVVDAGIRSIPDVEERAHRRCLARVHPRRPEVDGHTRERDGVGAPANAVTPFEHRHRHVGPLQRSRRLTKPDTPAPMTKTDSTGPATVAGIACCRSSTSTAAT